MSGVLRMSKRNRFKETDLRKLYGITAVFNDTTMILNVIFCYLLIYYCLAENRSRGKLVENDRFDYRVDWKKDMDHDCAPVNLHSQTPLQTPLKRIH